MTNVLKPRQGPVEILSDRVHGGTVNAHTGSLVSLRYEDKIVVNFVPCVAWFDDTLVQPFCHLVGQELLLSR